MSPFSILTAILGISVLVIVHESGHYLVARAFKMRVLRYSIGFGPVLFR
ncbi:MAG: site-2 protease family protein, partial [Deltaproteobacteria bacterium]|nr:site-2 protease family protein [Deltaproteobacteria bacterium]